MSTTFETPSLGGGGPAPNALDSKLALYCFMVVDQDDLRHVKLVLLKGVCMMTKAAHAIVFVKARGVFDESEDEVSG